jgi:hypothetical protein
MVLRASAFSAFKPTGGQVTAAWAVSVCCSYLASFHCYNCFCLESLHSAMHLLSNKWSRRLLPFFALSGCSWYTSYTLHVLSFEICFARMFDSLTFCTSIPPLGVLGLFSF